MGDCLLTFSHPVSKQTIHSLVVDVIEYVLFYRGQIPSLLQQDKNSKESNSLNGSTLDVQKMPEKSDDFKKFGNVLVYVDQVNQSHSQVKRPDRASQLFKESLSRFDTFFQDLLSLLQCNQVLEVVLKLGSSLPAPEIYHIKLPTKCEVAECNIDSTPIRKWRSQIYKTLFRSDFASNLVEKPLSISVMLHLLPGTKLSSNMEYKRFYTIPKSAKCKLVCFNCYCNHTSEPASHNVENATDGRSTTSLTDSALSNTALWVLVKPELKGIPKKQK